MKTLSVFTVGFVAGLFAPTIATTLHKLQYLNLPKHLTIDPVVIVLTLIAVWGISKARAKHKGGKS